jgi:hypothetical protein
LHFHCDALSAANTMRAFGRAAIEKNARRFNQLLHARAAQVRTVHRDNAVQPLAGLFGKNNEVVLHFVR